MLLAMLAIKTWRLEQKGVVGSEGITGNGSSANCLIGLAICIAPKGTKVLAWPMLTKRDEWTERPLLRAADRESVVGKETASDGGPQCALTPRCWGASVSFTSRRCAQRADLGGDFPSLVALIIAIPPHIERSQMASSCSWHFRHQLVVLMGNLGQAMAMPTAVSRTAVQTALHYCKAASEVYKMHVIRI